MQERREVVELATKKQRDALHKFGITFLPANLSKKEAWKILHELISLANEGRKEELTEFVEKTNKSLKGGVEP